MTRSNETVPAGAALLAASALMVAGASAKVVPTVDDGRVHFTQDHARQTVYCDGRRPFEMDAGRVSLKIVGPCTQVYVAGDHNDVETDVLAGGLVMITGAHNDVTWHQVSRGRPPALVDRGQSNTFHPNAPRY
jgi:Protein of unknown function (DUF3060)